MAYSLTYWDAIEQLRHHLGGDTSARAQRDLRTAITSALRVITQAHRWSYLYEELPITLNGAYSTGTVDYDHTGGANEKQLTLASGTWPSWAARGRVWISNVAYRVNRRISDSILTLDDNLNPGEDVASGTSYTLVQTSYALPSDFVSLDRPLAENSWHNMAYVKPIEWMVGERFDLNTGTPCRYTIMGDYKSLHTQALYVDPAPDADQSLRGVYLRRPRDLVYTGHELEDSQGVISTSGANITGTGTAFESGMVGSVLRISRNTKKPTDLNGENRYGDESTIKSYSSATAIVTDDSLNSAYSNVGYVVTDPIDIELAMHEAFFRCAEWQLETIRRGAGIQEKRALYEDALNHAKGADNRSFELRHMGDRHLRSRRLASMPRGDDI